MAAIALVTAAPTRAQTCSYNNNQPNTVSFGTIDPTLTTPRTFSITLNYRCTGIPIVTVTVSGTFDTGPGSYRLQNVTRQTEYMPYSISTVNDPGSKVTLNGLLVASSYRNAWVGNYTDTLRVFLLP